MLDIRRTVRDPLIMRNAKPIRSESPIATENIRSRNALTAAGISAYVTFLITAGLYFAKHAGYDTPLTSAVELFGPGGTAALTGIGTFYFLR